MPPDVTQSRRAEQRVTDRVKQHVGIGVSGQTQVIGNVHAADDQFAVRRKAVDVKSLPYPQPGHALESRVNMDSASNMSSA